MFQPDGPTFFELAQQALSSTERGYDLLAPKFDRTPFRTPDVILQETVSVLARLQPPRRALDLCCGTGAMMRHLRPIVREELTGVDFSAGMLAEADKSLRDAPGAAALRLERRDIFHMPWTEAFDLATCFGALGHVPHGRERELLRAVRTTLRPGGHFAFPSAPLPSLLSRAYWTSRAFNAAMHVRNALVHPPFVMFYLRFTLPEAETVLRQEGFDVTVVPHLYPPPFHAYALVLAKRR